MDHSTAGQRLRRRPPEKALTVHQPWAGLIIRGSKDIENRQWATRYRGRLWIHAGQRWDRSRDARRKTRGIDTDTWPSGVLLGQVTLLDITEEHPSAYADRGFYHWVFANPVPLPQPVPWRGAQGLWDVNLDDIASALMAEMAPPP